MRLMALVRFVGWCGFHEVTCRISHACKSLWTIGVPVHIKWEEVSSPKATLPLALSGHDSDLEATLDPTLDRTSIRLVEASDYLPSVTSQSD